MNSRFDTSSDEGPRKRLFAASLAIHVLLIGVFPILLASFRKDDEPEPVEVVFYKAAAEPRELQPPPQIEPEPPKIESEPPKVEPVEKPAPKPRREPPLKAPPPVKAEPKVAQVQPRPEPKPAPPPPPPKPRPVVRTGNFADVRAEPAVEEKTAKQTRTGGFTTAQAAEAPQRSEPKLRGSARVGGFEVDAAQPVETSQADKPERVVASTGFGESDEATPHRTTSSKSGAVSTGGFGDSDATAEPRRKRKQPVPNPDTPVEILSKPKPVYTTEARELKVEGEVVLKVIFVSTGELRVLGVEQGLGHGLDEAAVSAAKKIQFTPAKRKGQPVDHTAVLRIVFQLA